MISGGRYSQDQSGLRVQNITRDDDGRYLCRGEVPADGRYGERAIDVIVHSEPLFIISTIIVIVLRILLLYLDLKCQIYLTLLLSTT